ncbi:MAG TPA: peptide chain release factor N(5)-glutamine methyltransferase [Saprospiraceae bacterium]|nr:peptide chain release factor N(5)-glutamine methyltransferase [Saprospiraceae bacterium]HMX88121.1 peptide chain release factor N(5)-glutamine methyltransferase [Saprospiraceae bacterium]HMZ38912.1 peptide chain release factor N(5)-glutamine methyltransferase [Saprospiraceae bacterium]HNA64673.1 peptide chain release factor N(5)-glutamine methyltransferase [Saprospiraceae bacterium]HNB30489.1 peptide chain release factor N(5)-glutamine methyltransferase [Saprospiraceae bacterium]
MNNLQNLCQKTSIADSLKYNFELNDSDFNYISKSTKFSSILKLNAQEQVGFMDRLIEDLRGHRPVQYCLGEACFMDLELYVDERVLIPRPETEELVSWVLRICKDEGSRVLDIGTGSGAIALALRHARPDWKITGIDNSPEALQVANINAAKYNLSVDWLRLDFLNGAHLLQGPWDIIVSNPPYVAALESEHLDPEVLQFEPLQALFASGADPDIFYTVIARYALANLAEGGRVFVELNEFRYTLIRQIFSAMPFREIQLGRDMQGKNRMLMAIK